MSKETGGPAFPQNTKIVAAAGQELHQGFIGGISVRDYFAAHALQGLLAGYTKGVPPADLTADAAYSYADAMLKAREV